MSALHQDAEDRLLTVNEAAAKLQVSPDRVRRWVQRGELPAVRLGHRTVRFRHSALNAWIEDHEGLAR
jgi:excisionase family DNA binding protein